MTSADKICSHRRNATVDGTKTKIDCTEKVITEKSAFYDKTKIADKIAALGLSITDAQLTKLHADCVARCTKNSHAKLMFDKWVRNAQKANGTLPKKSLSDGLKAYYVWSRQYKTNNPTASTQDINDAYRQAKPDLDVPALAAQWEDTPRAEKPKKEDKPLCAGKPDGSPCGSHPAVNPTKDGRQPDGIHCHRHLPLAVA